MFALWGVMGYNSKVANICSLQYIPRGIAMNDQITLSEQQAQPVLCIRTTTSVAELPRALGQAYQAIAAYLAELGNKTPEAAYAAYYNMDMENLDVEMGFLVPEPLEGRGEIKASEIPAGLQVSCLYKGPYTGMKSVYQAMAQWTAEQGHTPVGTAYEIYYNSPAEVPESELLTKIIFPLK